MPLRFKYVLNCYIPVYCSSNDHKYERFFCAWPALFWLTRIPARIVFFRSQVRWFPARVANHPDQGQNVAHVYGGHLVCVCDCACACVCNFISLCFGSFLRVLEHQ
eukprot:Rmarinus@m.1742